MRKICPLSAGQIVCPENEKCPFWTIANEYEKRPAMCSAELIAVSLEDIAATLRTKFILS